MPAFTTLRSFSHLALKRADDSPSTSLTEAREALAYWRRREANLPWHRRAARAEAREMIDRWRGRLVREHLERWGLGSAGLLSPVVAFLTLPRRTRTRLIISTVMRTSAARRMRRVAIGFGLVTFAAFALFAFALTQVL